jgi:hypothetical protein
MQLTPKGKFASACKLRTVLSHLPGQGEPGTGRDVPGARQIGPTEHQHATKAYYIQQLSSCRAVLVLVGFGTLGRGRARRTLLSIILWCFPQLGPLFVLLWQNDASLLKRSGSGPPKVQRKTNRKMLTNGQRYNYNVF